MYLPEWTDWIAFAIAVFVTGASLAIGLRRG